MRTCFFSCAFFLATIFTAGAQLTISLPEPPSAVVQKSQLWNVIMIYSGTSPISVTVGLSLTDAMTNQPVMTAMSRPVMINSGVRQFRSADMEPAQYTYQSSTAIGLSSPNAFIPIGTYRACYTVYFSREGNKDVAAEECLNFEVAPLNPPLLNIPADSATVETAYPQFVWLPPTPMILFSDLNYNILVTEVQQGQSPYEAIQENMPVYSMDHLRSMVQNYPASYKSLDTGRVYAWRIIAKNGESFAGQSDVWTFRIASRKPEVLIPANKTYLELKNDNSYLGTALISGDTLAIKFYSYDRTHDAAIRFLDEQGAEVKTLNEKVLYGNNFMVLVLNHSFSSDKTYFVEIADLQNGRYRASFRMTK